MNRRRIAIAGGLAGLVLAAAIGLSRHNLHDTSQEQRNPYADVLHFPPHGRVPGTLDAMDRYIVTDQNGVVIGYIRYENGAKDRAARSNNRYAFDTLTDVERASPLVFETYGRR